MRRLNKNPTDYQLIKRLKVKKYENPLDSGFYWYDVYLDEVKPEKLIGEFGYQKDRNYISTVGIHSDFQRKGIGTFIYDMIEQDFDIELVPSDIQSKKAKLFWYDREYKKLEKLKRNPMKTRSKTSKRKSSCKCKGRSPGSLRKCSCSRKNPSTLPKVPTSEFRNLNPDKYYIFHFYGNDSLKGKPVLSDSKRFIVESNGNKSIHYWDDLLNVYGPFNTLQQTIDAQRALLIKGYL